MPLIMDEYDQDMEDLFGDSEPVHVQIAATSPAVKGLAERLDELAGTGCCQKISWSRFGTIAAVDSDCHGVHVYNYVRDAQTGAWNLSKPIPIPPGTDSLSLNEIIHVAWNSMGNALSVVDSCGRILIYTTASVQGDLSLARQNLMDQDDSMHTIVGLHWLPVYPQEEKIALYWTAAQSGNDWVYRADHLLTRGPHNPLPLKSSLICLSRNGLIRLMYEQQNGSWGVVPAELESTPIPIEKSFSHASFVPSNGNGLTLVTYDISRILRLYQITINWNESSDKNDGQTTHYQIKPMIQVASLLSMQASIPSHPMSADPTLSPLMDSSSFELTHLDILAPSREQNTESNLPLILAIFTTLPSPSTNLLDSTQQYHQSFSVVQRWKLHKDVQCNLSPCFDQLAVKKKSTSAVDARRMPQLEQLPDVNFHSAITSVTLTRNDTLLTFVLGDGNIQTRYRDSLEIVSVDGSQHEVHSMAQSGFAFPLLERSLHTAFSPCQCIIAVRKDDGSIELKNVEYTQGPLTELKEDGMNFGAVTSLLALQFISSSMQYRNTDDLVSVLLKDTNQDFRYRFITQTCRALGIHFNFVTEEEQKRVIEAFRFSSLYKLLSLQNVLGRNGNGSRNLTSMVAWIALNLRQSCFTMLAATRTHNEALRADVAGSLVGLFRWCTDFLVYLLQELFDTSFKLRGKEDDRSYLQKYLNTSNSPGLIIILASFTRVQLRMLCGPLRSGNALAINGMKTAASIEQRNAFLHIIRVFDKTPLQIKALERYIGEVDVLVRNAYSKAGMTDQERKATERDLFWRCEIPEVLMPAVKEMLTDKLRNLMEVSDPGKVHNHDISWLNLTDDKRTKQMHEKVNIDVIRKVPLGPQVRLRRCPRCLSVMEDLTTQQLATQPAWVSQNQKNCVCFSSWIVMDPPET